MTSNPAPAAVETAVSWTDVVRFVRQLSHDLRNSLNALELQSAFLAELAESAEMKGEVKRLRAMTGEFGDRLEKITGAISPIKLHPMAYKASDFLEDLSAKVTALYPTERGSVILNSDVPVDAMIEVDPQVLQQAFVEIFVNAFQHQRGEGPIAVDGVVASGTLTVTFREPKSAAEFSVENWGRQPLQSLRSGSYGLGLYRTRAIIEAHDGTFAARYDKASRSLVSTVVLPLAK